MFSKTIEFMKAKAIKDVEEASSEELLEEHIRSRIMEAEDMRLTEDTADVAAKADDVIVKLVQAQANKEKATAERRKVELQIMEAARRRYINWDQLLPKLVGICVTGGVTVFWLLMEQGNVVPMRLIQMTNSLTIPRGL